MKVKTNFKEPKMPKDDVYLKYVRQLPCVICENFEFDKGGPPSNSHHTFCGRYSQEKSPDQNAIPLCPSHHQGFNDDGEGKLAIHKCKESWVEQYGPDTDYIDVTRDAVLREFGYTPKGINESSED